MFKAISIVSFQSYRKTKNLFRFYRSFGENVLPILWHKNGSKMAESWQSFAVDE